MCPVQIYTDTHSCKEKRDTEAFAVHEPFEGGVFASLGVVDAMRFKSGNQKSVYNNADRMGEKV